MKSNVFFISDTHFLHINIIKYCNRPENFNSLIIKNWNDVVKPNDIVFHLGDFQAGVGKVKDGKKIVSKIIQKLNGHKILIRGNHDYYDTKWYIENGFESVHDYLCFENVFLTHYPLQITSHLKQKEKNQIRFLMKLREECQSKYVIHGHTHNRHVDLQDHFNVSVEAINYKPISFQDIMKKLNKECL